MANPTVEIPLNTNQRYQYVTLWSIVCAPFFFSCDMDEIDEFTIGLLCNADIVNINQDELGHVAEVVKNDGNETIMVKNLADDLKVVAVFNTSDINEEEIEVEWGAIGVDKNKRLNIYDVWRQKEIGVAKENFSVKLSPNGVGLFILKD